MVMLPAVEDVAPGVRRCLGEVSPSPPRSAHSGAKCAAGAFPTRRDAAFGIRYAGNVGTVYAGT